MHGAGAEQSPHPGAAGTSVQDSPRTHIRPSSPPPAPHPNLPEGAECPCPVWGTTWGGFRRGLAEHPRALIWGCPILGWGGGAQGLRQPSPGHINTSKLSYPCPERAGDDPASTTPRKPEERGGHTHPSPALTRIIFFWGKTGAIPSPRNKTPMQLNGVNVNGFIEPQNLPARLQSSVYTRRTKIKSSREEKYQRNKHGVGRVEGRHTQQQGKAGANPTPENKISV